MSTAPRDEDPASPLPAGVLDGPGDPLAHGMGGAGEDVVLLLNGGMMTFPSWRPVSRHLVDTYRVLGCDFRGQLKTGADGHTRVEDNVPDVVELLDALGLERVHVLGASFGGMVGLALAGRHPDRVRSLALVTTAEKTPPGMKEDSRYVQDLARAVAEGGPTEPFYDHVFSGVYSEEYRRRHADELADRRSARLPASWYRGLHGILQSIQDFDLSEFLPRIQHPTLVVHAALDEVMPEERARALVGAIDGAELHIHPSAGHVLILEDSRWVAETYLDFIRRRFGGAQPSSARPNDAQTSDD